MSSTTNDEECTICLEYISLSDSIGTIPNCRHYYHDKCILQWSKHSNSCPTCRIHFHKIENCDNNNKSRIILIINVKDKLLPNDAIDDIPEEFIIRANQIPPNHHRQNARQSGIPQNQPNSNDDFSIQSNGICSICSSADYTLSRTRSLIYCQICASKFHSSCLGISTSNSDDFEEWCCPICDSPQELIILPPTTSSSSSNSLNNRRSIFNSTRSSRRTNQSSSSSNNSVRTTRITRNGTNLHSLTGIGPGINSLSTIGSSTERATRPLRSGLIIHNDNDEIDDDFLYSGDLNDNSSTIGRNHSSNYTNPVFNGGVMLRREMRQNQNLSRDEVQSWDLFEDARNINESNNELAANIGENNENSRSDVRLSNDEINNPNRKRRRRRRIQQEDNADLSMTNHTFMGTSQDLQPNNSNDISSSSSSSSRIASLINQMKTTSKPSVTPKIDTNNAIPVADDFGSPQSSISASHLPSVYSPIDSRSVDSDYQTDPETNSNNTTNANHSNNLDKSINFNSSTISKNSAGSVAKKNLATEGEESNLPELSFDQKSEIQKHIRNNLRPIYKPKSSENSNKVISSESSYIRINKSISRKIYAFILSGAKIDNGQYNQRSIDHYFEHDSNLKELVDRHAQSEISKL